MNGLYEIARQLAGPMKGGSVAEPAARQAAPPVDQRGERGARAAGVHVGSGGSFRGNSPSSRGTNLSSVEADFSAAWDDMKGGF